MYYTYNVIKVFVYYNKVLFNYLLPTKMLRNEPSANVKDQSRLWCTRSALYSSRECATKIVDRMPQKLCPTTKSVGLDAATLHWAHILSMRSSDVCPPHSGSLRSE